MKKTEHLHLKKKLTLMNTDVYTKDKVSRLVNENKDKLEKHQSKNKKTNIMLDSLSIMDKSDIFSDKNTNFNKHQSMNVLCTTNNNLNLELNAENTQEIKKINEPIKTKRDTYTEMYVPEKYGLKHNNTFVMTFCQPTLNDYFKWLLGIHSYAYDDYIQYKLTKKNCEKQDILIKTIIVEKNAFHCQGLVKKLIVIKDFNHVPKKIIFT